MTSRISLWIVIKIKICAEYREMLPRSRLLCQKPGLRPIGRSPGAPDKSSRGLCSMSQVLCTFLNLFYSMHAPFLYSSVGLVGNSAGLPPCTVPSAILHCNQNEAGHQTIKAPSMPGWAAAGPWKTLWHECHRTGEVNRYNWWNLHQWEVFSTKAKWMERVFCISVSYFTVF